MRFEDHVSQIQTSQTHDRPTIEHFVHIGGEGVDRSLHFETLLTNSTPDPATCEHLEAEDIAALIFTGGTSGALKATQVSHRMIAWNTLNTVIHDVHHDDIYLNVFPMVPYRRPFCLHITPGDIWRHHNPGAPV